MLRQNAMQPPNLNGTKSEAEKLKEAADIESLRAAYMAVVGESGRVVSGKVMKEALRTGVNPDGKPGSRQTGAVQIPGQISPVAAQRQVAASSPIPPRATTLKPALPPIDAAIQAISEADSIQANPRSSAHKPQATIAQALQRNWDFTSEQNANKSNASLVAETPGNSKANPAPKQTNLKSTEPVVTAAARHDQVIVSQQSTPQIVQAESSGHQARPVPEDKPANSSERAWKLPKFLVAPEETAVEATKPRQKEGAKSKGKTTFGLPSGNQTSQNLFGDLKLATPESVEALIVEKLDQEERAHAASTTPTPSKSGNQQFFDTTGGKTANRINPAKQGSFMDVLTTSAETELKSVGDVPIEGETEAEWMARYQRYESVWVKLFERPRLLLGMLGLGIVSCSVYIALGYWWFGGSPISQAAEPVNMLDVQEDVNRTGQEDPTSVFNNIRSVQQETHETKSKGPEAPSSKSEVAKSGPKSEPKFGPKSGHRNILLAQATPAAGSLAGEPAGASGATEPLKSEPVGRLDPFDPLVTGGGDVQNAKPEETKKKDVLMDLQYTGFIGDINSRDKVAIIRVNDSITGATKTQIKKVGESFPVSGENVVLRSISKKSLLLSVQGETRQLDIQPYQALKPTTQNNSGNGGAPGSSGTGDSSVPAGRSTNGDPSRVSLREPGN
jgi:hypothetical protein